MFAFTFTVTSVRTIHKLVFVEIGDKIGRTYTGVVDNEIELGL
jgi:hypothetical protein